METGEIYGCGRVYTGTQNHNMFVAETIYRSTPPEIYHPASIAIDFDPEHLNLMIRFPEAYSISGILSAAMGLS